MSSAAGTTDPVQKPSVARYRATILALSRTSKMWRFGLARELQKIVGKDAVLEGDDLRRRYAAFIGKSGPHLVCLPKSAPEISQIVEVARASKVPLALATAAASAPASYPRDSILIDLGRMNKILEIDSFNLCAVVEPL